MGMARCLGVGVGVGVTIVGCWLVAVLLPLGQKGWALVGMVALAFASCRCWGRGVATIAAAVSVCASMKRGIVALAVCEPCRWRLRLWRRFLWGLRDVFGYVCGGVVCGFVLDDDGGWGVGCCRLICRQWGSG